MTAVPPAVASRERGMCRLSAEYCSKTRAGIHRDSREIRTGVGGRVAPKPTGTAVAGYLASNPWSASVASSEQPCHGDLINQLIIHNQGSPPNALGRVSRPLVEPLGAVIVSSDR